MEASTRITEEIKRLENNFTGNANTVINEGGSI
jgi:hypothetical protein